MTTTEVTVNVLRNKGCPVQLAKLDADGDVKRDAEGAEVKHELWLRFDANSLSEIEMRFGSIDDFEAALNLRPFASIRAALAFALGHDEPTMGKMLLTDQTAEYSNSIGTSLALATGVDPTKALQMYERGLQLGATLRAKLDEALQEMLDEASEHETTTENEDSASLGSNGTSSGADSAETLSSSGD